MKKYILTFLFFTVLSGSAFTKVAYIPLVEPTETVFNGSSYTYKSIMALDLENGDVLKVLTIPSVFFNSQIILNNNGSQLYIVGGDNLFIIDTTKLEVTDTIQLPTRARGFFLNSDNNKIYYSTYYDSNTFYQIDLNNQVVTEALTFLKNEVIYSYIVNKSVNTMVIYTEKYDPVTDEYSYLDYIYDIDSLSIKYDNPQAPIYFLNENGLDYYSFDSSTFQLISNKLEDNSQNWSTTLNEERGFNTIVENQDNTITIIGELATYEINKITGQKIIQSDYNLQAFRNNDSHFSINKNEYLTLNRPSIICSRGPNSCHAFPVETYINLVNLRDSTSTQLLYSDTYAGSYAFGNLIGEKFFRIPTIPAFKSRWLLLMIVIFILFIAYKTYFDRKNVI